MKWLARSFILLSIGLCASAALLVRPLGKQLLAWSTLTGTAELGQAEESPHKATPSMVAAMHARDAEELQKIIGQIRDEFGTDTATRPFSSHHVARDYLARLRLAAQAEAMGFHVDPHAFGDDLCMRRYLEALKAGIESPATAPPTASSLTDDTGAPGPSTCPRRDYLFIYGHRYYRDAEGKYVRADGTVLDTSALRPVQPKRSVPPPSETSLESLPISNLPHDLDELLKLLAPEQNRHR